MSADGQETLPAGRKSPTAPAGAAAAPNAAAVPEVERTPGPSADPPTHASLLMSLLSEPGGHQAAARHVMEFYREPLRAYVLGSSFARLGEWEDLVNGFFAHHDRWQAFFADWLISGRSFRRWLVTAFKHHLLEQSRRLGHQPATLPDQANLPARHDASATGELAFDRELAIRLVHEALRRAQANCHAHEWPILLRHIVDGRTRQQIAAETGLTDGQIAHILRKTGNEYQRQQRALLAWPGAGHAEIDDEIRQMMEVLRP
jgi:DNA-directed RNA polymerase specialized sigma24 family protein